MSHDHLSQKHGVWDTCHRISIPSINHEADGMQIERHLKSLTGVKKVTVSVSTRQIHIAYDQTHTDFDQIQEKLEEIGFPSSDDWWSRKKAAWFQYLDTNARTNAKTPPAPCCGDPKGLNRGRK
ncbi:MAG: heavy metal-associated domain-containing protein [Sedimenticola sp.]